MTEHTRPAVKLHKSRDCDNNITDIVVVLGSIWMT